mgnify:CR=1 FL=1
MSTTLIPALPSLSESVTSDEVLSLAYQGYAESTANMDKSGDIESHEYNAGAADAYREVIRWFTGTDMLETTINQEKP